MARAVAGSGSRRTGGQQKPEKRKGKKDGATFLWGKRYPTIVDRPTYVCCSASCDVVYSTKLLRGKPNPGDPAIGSEFSGLEVIDAKVFVIGVNSLSGGACAVVLVTVAPMPTTLSLLFAAPELLVMLERSNSSLQRIWSSGFRRLTSPNADRIRPVHTRCVRWQCGIPGCGPCLQQAL